MINSFLKYHISVKLLYFILIVFISMSVIDTGFVMISLLSSVAYNFRINGLKNTWKLVWAIIPTVVVIGIISMIFGVNLTDYRLYFENLFRLSAVFISVIMWFNCFGRIIKFKDILCLFSGSLPKTSLMFLICFNCIYRLLDQANQIEKFNIYMGDFNNYNRFVDKIRSFSRVIISIVMWSLENSVIMFESMKCRGYGLSKRTRFYDSKFNVRDIIILIILIFLGISTVLGHFIKENGIFNFYLVTYIFYLILCFFPTILNFLEDVKWRILK